MRKIDRYELWMWLVPFDQAGIHLKPLVLWLTIFFIMLAFLIWWWS